MNNPTEEQKKKFWEWCGWGYKPDVIDKTRGDSRGSIYYLQEAGWYFSQTRYMELPTLDLNNLFKYAVPRVPKAKRILFSYPTETTVTKGWIVDVESGGYAHLGANDDPALALFWAIWRVIDG